MTDVQHVSSNDEQAFVSMNTLKVIRTKATEYKRQDNEDVCELQILKKKNIKNQKGRMQIQNHQQLGDVYKYDP